MAVNREHCFPREFFPDGIKPREIEREYFRKQGMPLGNRIFDRKEVKLDLLREIIYKKIEEWKEHFDKSFKEYPVREKWNPSKKKVLEISPKASCKKDENGLSMIIDSEGGALSCQFKSPRNAWEDAYKFLTA